MEIQRNNSLDAQRARLLEHLKVFGSGTTIELRRDLDVLQVAARIFELRKFGHVIHTVWAHQPTECGQLHRVARYVLQSGGAA